MLLDYGNISLIYQEGLRLTNGLLIAIGPWSATLTGTSLAVLILVPPTNTAHFEVHISVYKSYFSYIYSGSEY